jgi:5-enolpyruvylshikimate-3-phosphate synthase
MNIIMCILSLMILIAILKTAKPIETAAGVSSQQCASALLIAAGPSWKLTLPAAIGELLVS